jgi:hypothetical protein
MKSQFTLSCYTLNRLYIFFFFSCVIFNCSWKFYKKNNIILTFNNFSLFSICIRQVFFFLFQWIEKKERKKKKNVCNNTHNKITYCRYRKIIVFIKSCKLMKNSWIMMWYISWSHVTYIWYNVLCQKITACYYWLSLIY